MMSGEESNRLMDEAERDEDEQNYANLDMVELVVSLVRRGDLSLSEIQDRIDSWRSLANA